MPHAVLGRAERQASLGFFSLRQVLQRAAMKQLRPAHGEAWGGALRTSRTSNSAARTNGGRGRERKRERERENKREREREIERG